MSIRGAIQRFNCNVQAITVLFSTIRNPALRALIPEINKQRRTMRGIYESLPLPYFLTYLTPMEADLRAMNPEHLRKLLDAVAQLDWLSPFGICLRRSLLRYHFLRRSGVELHIVFGVRFRQSGEPAGIAGHAWNMLDGQPYNEREEDYQGFTVLYSWPEEGLGEAKTKDDNLF